MSSRPTRALGGGRILGSGKSLSPAVSPIPPNHHKRNASLLSPSESSLSLSSQTSISPTPTFAQDITSNVSLENPNHAAAAAASSRLVCPICNEDMVCQIRRKPIE
ncbi:hypothetical protein EJ05DRAFT_200785 [Pseudovirgaria hyperparasitica]|uniref:Uncharacterized protein n=1 Tax=Pseudovirgaria hyperparasitica TaxID=470096 RepID=A0A6A6WJ34_9PEZI|nr:uncharacterized protein EJ05DRAFT_200785 [Pseudovirgaria hyperparasitica]KAF2762214.1 hypothetical protein EJ05DRAFT_200785 [Pseudovirgaria hyperparasitica]